MRKSSKGITFVAAVLNLCLVGMFAQAQDYQGAYHLVRKPVRRVRVVLTDIIHAQDLNATTWGIAAAVPPSFDWQQVTKSQFQIPGVPGADIRRFPEHSPLQQMYHAAVYPVTEQRQLTEATAQGTYEATLYAISLEPGAPEKPVPMLSDTEREYYLASTERTNYQDPAFQSWLQQTGLLRSRGETELAFAYRAMAYIGAHFTYRWVVGSSEEPASVAANGASHCGGIANLFIGTMRANKVPARLDVGRSVLRSSTPKDTVTNGCYTMDPGTSHVTTEFYVQGVGWVPAEPTGAIGQKDIHSYFGKTDGTMLIQHFDTMWLDNRMRSLQSMEWCFGSWKGTWNGFHITDNLEVQQLDPPK